MVDTSDKENNLFFEDLDLNITDIEEWNPINVNGKTSCDGVSISKEEIENVCGQNEAGRIDILAIG